MPLSKSMLASEEEYWCTLGAAARFREAIRNDPAFADTLLPAFTEEQLDKERNHIRWACNLAFYS